METEVNVEENEKLEKTKNNICLKKTTDTCLQRNHHEELKQDSPAEESAEIRMENHIVNAVNEHRQPSCMNMGRNQLLPLQEDKSNHIQCNEDTDNHQLEDHHMTKRQHAAHSVPKPIGGSNQNSTVGSTQNSIAGSQLIQNHEDHDNHTNRANVDYTAHEDYEKDTRCGLGMIQHPLLQRLASKKSYVLIYGLMGMIHFVIASYFISTISTMEKRFKIPSRTSGLISSAWDIGGICSSLLISYLGSRGHKTRWVAAGSLLVALSCFMRLIPHFMYGPGQDAQELTLEYRSSFQNSSFTEINSGDSELLLQRKVHVCGVEMEDDEDCATGFASNIPSTIFFLSHIMLGVGTCMYYTLGIAYLDDNVRKNKTPILLAVWQCIRMLGPTFGFLFGSYALKIYVDPSLHPTITSDDPRWIGAWWLGWTPLGTVTGVLAIVLAFFPKKLPRAAQRIMAENETQNKTVHNVKKSFADFKVTLRRLFKNKVLLLNTMSAVFFMFGFIGYWTFMPKYLETMFRQSASRASLITGSVGLICSALGIMTSGAVISKFKPRPRYLAAWNVFVECFDVIGHFSYAFISCPIDDLHGSWNPDNSWNLTAECNGNCDCGPSVKYSPVCSFDSSTMFYSACHAGCTGVDIINGTKVFTNCSCIGAGGRGWATDGPCPMDCTDNFTIYLVVQCIMRLFSASGRAGNIIIQFRCVDPDDKSMSIGLAEALLCALAFIPGPIVYGMLLDSSCMVWGQTCGQSGNCWLYDGQSLGYLLNFTASAFILGGTFFDVGVWYYVKDLKIYDDDDVVDKEKEKLEKMKNRREKKDKMKVTNEHTEQTLL